MTSIRLLFAICATFLFAACAESAPESAAEDASSANPASSSPLPDLVPGPDGKVHLTDAEWRARLSPAQYKILREAGTERACSGAYWKNDPKKGVYHCAACGQALFHSDSKFDSGTGWPSFAVPIANGRIINRSDTSFGMVRTENLCARCESHLGHSFEDGPPPDGLRYCMNSLALRFVPEEAAPKPAAAKPAPAESPDAPAAAK